MTQSPLQSSSCVGLLGMAGVEPTGISQSLLFSKFTLMDLFVGRQTSLFPRTPHEGTRFVLDLLSSHKTVKELLFYQEQAQRGT